MPVSSLLIQVDPEHPERQSHVEELIASLNGAEVFRSAPGHIVALTDTPDTESDLSLIETIETLEGVVSTSIVFTHHEPPLNPNQRSQPGAPS